MGYDLKARNKNVAPITIGAFSWPIILQETGAGYVLGYGSGLIPGTYVYSEGNHGSPVTNDGYRVSAEESRSMAKCCEGYLSVQEFVNKEWSEMSLEDKKQREGCNVYRKEVGEKFLEQIRRFLDFAKNSQGFVIR